jgi:hypothetical protein
MRKLVLSRGAWPAYQYEGTHSNVILISFASTYLGEYGCISRAEIQKSLNHEGFKR